MEYFIFNVTDEQHGASAVTTTTVAFCPSPDAAPESLKSALKAFFDHTVPTDNVLLLGPEGLESTLQTLSTDSFIVNALPHYTQLTAQQKIHTNTISSNNIHTKTTKEKPGTGKLPTLNQIRETGLRHLVEKHHALIDANPHFHYQKNNTTHTDKFLRTANLLVHGPEIAFIASWIAPYITDKTHFILTDTPAIHALAYAAVAIKKTLIPTLKSPVIDSFGSYSGIDQFTFRQDHLVIISASTSGNLQQRLLQKSKTKEDTMVTVLHNGETLPSGHLLCHLNPKTFTQIENHKASSCAMCKRGVPLIIIAGDHFIPETPPVKEVVLLNTDSSTELRTFLKKITLKKLIKINKAVHSDAQKPNEVFIDAANFLTAIQSAPNQELERILYKIPATTNRIIHVDDEGSRTLAEHVQTVTSSYTNRTITILNASEIFVNPHAYTSQTGTTLVVASSLSTGRDLLPISQILRIIQENQSISYLVGIARARNKSSLDQLCSNLQFGERPKQHSLHIVERVFLPAEHALHANAWEMENDFLYYWEKQNLSGDLLNVVRDRLKQIETDGGASGLQDALFWPSSGGSTLKLTPKFALWDHDYTQNSPSQSDVYLTITAILHYLREGMGRLKPWSQNHYNRHVISPDNFYRYNDGVIQASLLRAAHPSELDYQSDLPASRRMLDWILFSISNGNVVYESALKEFLLSLAIGRLQLHKTHHEEVIRALENQPDSTLGFFLHALQHPRN
ncbi:MAG: hypothetical protein NTX13_01760 [Acidobacteria bacterium]|nr:hypothetical protein [Acidobacteriota bacterium]